MKSKRTVLLWTLLGVMAVAAAWNWREMTFQRRAAIGARDDLVECRRMAGRIEQFRRRPARAVDRERLSQEVTGLVEQAARSAGVLPGSLSRITPGPPQRLSDSVYKEKPTRILLRNVTLKQVAALSASLLRAGIGLRTKTIRLSAPRHDDTGDLWTAELGIVYLIYDPPRIQE